jgi:hypothetical protein
LAFFVRIYCDKKRVVSKSNEYVSVEKSR